MATQRVLLVHANADCRTIYGSVLRYEGYEVRETSESDLALALLREQTFDLVIADLYVRSEIDECFVRRVRRDGGLGHLPVVVLTAWTTAVHRRAGIDEGADAFLPLPVSPQEFLSVIHDLLAPPMPPTHTYRTFVVNGEPRHRSTPL